MQTFSEWELDLKNWQRSSSLELIGKKAIFFAEIGSTNKFLKENTQLKHGTLVIAQQQNQGKGQKDRTWISNSGGLYMSVKLEIQPNQFFQPFWLTAIFSLGLCKALIKLRLKPTIKWPNDVLINNRKVAGILTETVLSQNSITAIIGLGCNVNNSLEEIFNKYPNLSTKISSIKLELDSKSAIPLQNILEPTLKYVESKIKGKDFLSIPKIKKEWLELCQIENKDVEIQKIDSQEIITGFVTNVSDSGSLLVRLESGAVEEFTAGEIKIKR